MKDKLEPNMYVRTNDGYIAKYDKSKHNCSGKYYGFASTIRDLRWEEYDDDCFLWESELKNIVKASYNIVDILEVGDILVDDTNRKLEILLIDNELMVRNAGLIYDNNYYLPIKSIAIKSAITHEQMEQMAYKVGE